MTFHYEGNGSGRAVRVADAQPEQPPETRPEQETPLATGAAVEPADAPFAFPSDGGAPSDGDDPSAAPSSTEASDPNADADAASEEAGNSGAFLSQYPESAG